MLKKYKSKSCVSINVVLPTGGNTHICFSAKTGGGSVYYTENETIQKGLEGHPKYGKLFVLENEMAAKKPSAKVQKAAVTAEQPAKAENKLVEVKMSCNDDAKDYVADKFGVSRSKMRSRTDIEKVAAENGVKIIWT